MPRLPLNDGLSRSQRYRQQRVRQGMKLVRLWVPDPTAPDFAQEVRRQALLLRDAPEENEALAFIEAVAEAQDWR